MEINKCEHEMKSLCTKSIWNIGRIKTIPLAVHSRADFFPLRFYTLDQNSDWQWRPHLKKWLFPLMFDLLIIFLLWCGLCFFLHVDNQIKMKKKFTYLKVPLNGNPVEVFMDGSKWSSNSFKLMSILDEQSSARPACVVPSEKLELNLTLWKGWVFILFALF